MRYMYIYQSVSINFIVHLEAMTKHLAVEWGPNGVRMMCVAPGPIADTEGMRRLGELSAFRTLS